MNLFHIENLTVLENKLCNEVNLAKQQFESDLVNGLASSSHSDIYRYLKQLTKSHSLPSTMFSRDGTSKASSDVDKASLFNEYFHSVVKTNDVNPDNLDSSSTQDSLNSISLSDLDVYSALIKLNPKKAMGYDGINFMNSVLVVFYGDGYVRI